jgi:hypothetical protein
MAPPAPEYLERAQGNTVVDPVTWRTHWIRVPLKKLNFPQLIKKIRECYGTQIFCYVHRYSPQLAFPSNFGQNIIGLTTNSHKSRRFSKIS